MSLGLEIVAANWKIASKKVVASLVGAGVSNIVGVLVGIAEGLDVGKGVVGVLDGKGVVGEGVGTGVVGALVGEELGVPLGLCVGLLDGVDEGLKEGRSDGLSDGAAEGATLGLGVTSTSMHSPVEEQQMLQHLQETDPEPKQSEESSSMTESEAQKAFGTKPDKLGFRSNDKYLRFLRNPICRGIASLRLLFARDRYCNSWSMPISDGILSSKAFPSSLSSLMFVKRPISDGMEPLKALGVRPWSLLWRLLSLTATPPKGFSARPLKSNLVNEVRKPISEGIDPVSEFPVISMSSRDVKIPSSAGIVPCIFWLNNSSRIGSPSALQVTPYQLQ